MSTATTAELEKFFTEAGSRLRRDEVSLAVGVERLNRFFNDATRQVDLAERADRHLASGFNVFDLIRPDENRLSDVLALLLNPRGAHGQGDLFLRLLISKLDAGLSVHRTKHAWVQREAPTRRIENNRRRMDVLVDIGDLVVIENKLDSAEQPEQVKDYLEHLRHFINARSAHGILIYLTPTGRIPESINREIVQREVADNRLRCWSYGQHLCAWLDECRSQCEAPRFRAFLADFIHYIERAVKRESEEQEV